MSGYRMGEDVVQETFFPPKVYTEAKKIYSEVFGPPQHRLYPFHSGTMFTSSTSGYTARIFFQTSTMFTDLSDLFTRLIRFSKLSPIFSMSFGYP